MNNNNNNGKDVARRVARRHPPTFLWQEDSLVLEDWIRTFDKLFDEVNCPLDQWVDMETYYHHQEADNLWATVGSMMCQQPGFGWEIFKEAMRERFYPEHVKIA